MSFGYYVSTPDNPVTIDLADDLNSLLVFFATAGTGQGVSALPINYGIEMDEDRRLR